MPRPSPEQLLIQTASAQFGLINLVQALAAGYTIGQVKRRLRSGRWQRVLERVYRIAGAPSSWEADAMAALLWAVEGCGLSFRAAARIHGIYGFQRAPVEISVVDARNWRDLPFTVHRCDRHLLEDIVQVRPFAVTSVPRTLMDLGGVKEPRAERALDQMLREGKTSIGEAWLFHDKEWTRGRRGIAWLRECLTARTDGLAPTESDSEDMLWNLIVRAGDIEWPTRQHWIVLPSGRARLDFAYPDRMIAIEADSYGSHGDLEKFDSDRSRDAEAQALGWVVLRFTWAQIRFRPDWVLDMIRTPLALRSPFASVR